MNTLLIFYLPICPEPEVDSLRLTFITDLIHCSSFFLIELPSEAKARINEYLFLRLLVDNPFSSDQKSKPDVIFKIFDNKPGLFLMNRDDFLDVWIQIVVYYQQTFNYLTK